jgi:CarD family transcriptional regulator
MQFQAGEQAVYPGCGVGRIEAIQEQGGGEKMYVISFPDSKTRVWVPLRNAQDLGLRPIMTRTKLDRTLDAITRQSAPPKRQTWNRRFKIYSEKIQTNDPEAIGEVLGELAAIRQEKTLSFGERRIFRKAEQLLIQEAALVREIDEDKFSKELESLLTKASTPTPATPRARSKAKARVKA